MPAPDPPDGPVTYSQQYRRCGKPNCATCAAGQPGHGPYWYGFWRHNGRLRSRYLGKNQPDAARRPDQAVSAPGRGEQTLRVRTLGGFTVWRGDEPIPNRRWAGRRAADLFKCLISAPHHRLHREQAIDLLWPQAPPSAGAGNLRAAVYLLRRILAPMGDHVAARSYVRMEGDMLALAPSPTDQAVSGWLDAEVFTQAAAAALAGSDAALCQAALDLYAGDYLPDDIYRDWAAARREELRQHYLRVLLRLTDLASAPAQAERTLRAVLSVEPTHEAAAQRLMETLAAGGRRGDALHIYEALAETLRQDLGILPGAAIEAVRLRVVAPGTVAGAGDPSAAEQLMLPRLPQPLTGFVGRERAIADVAGLLTAAPGAAARLLTLTGTGGCGKTRLALRVAGGLLPAYADGVALVELPTLADDALTPLIVATALGITVDSRGSSSLERLVGALRHRQLLLILDNCEHLIAGCHDLVAALLLACPRLQVLATSRQPLGVAGEVTWRVPSLSLPPATAGLEPADLERCEAVQLFVQRARLCRPEFKLTPRNGAAVAEICQRVAGIPLALELAAARLEVLSVHDLAARLRQQFTVLGGAPRRGALRHQTLRATLDWSYELLSDEERAALRRLAVFAGGCSLAAAEVMLAPVLAADAMETAPSSAVLTVLTALIRHSLLMVDGADDATRYTLLEMVRQHALDHLRARGEESEARGAHLAWCLRLVQDTLAAGTGTMGAGALPALLDPEHGNLRAALNSAAGSPPPMAADGLQLAAALGPFWEARGHAAEGRRVLADLLARAPDAPPQVRARALNAAGNLAFRQGDYAEATTLLRRSLAERRTMGDTRGMALTLNNLGLVADEQGRHADARAFFTESLALKEQQGDQRGMANSLTNLGLVAGRQGDLAGAVALHQRSLALLRDLGDRQGAARALNNLADALVHQGDFGRATALLEESAALAWEVGDHAVLAVTAQLEGFLAHRQGDQEGALAGYADALRLRAKLGDKQGLAETLEGLAAVWLARQEPQRAARLYGAADAVRTAIGAPLPAASHAAGVGAHAQLAEQLGVERLARLLAQGQALPLDQAIGEALSDTVAPGAGTG